MFRSLAYNWSWSTSKNTIDILVYFELLPFLFLISKMLQLLMRLVSWQHRLWSVLVWCLDAVLIKVGLRHISLLWFSRVWSSRNIGHRISESIGLWLLRGLLNSDTRLNIWRWNANGWNWLRGLRHGWPLIEDCWGWRLRLDRDCYGCGVRIRTLLHDQLLISCIIIFK